MEPQTIILDNLSFQGFVFATEDETNAFLVNNREYGFIGEDVAKGEIYVVRNDDFGVKIY
jgi:hypothetical protein